MSDDAKSLLQMQGRLAALRAQWDGFWTEIAYRVLPSSATFTTYGSEGEKRTERVFDPTAITANERFAAWVSEGIHPRDQMWHGIESDDEELRDDQEVKEYFERLTKLVFTQRYRPWSNFNSQRQECLLSLGAFGNHILFVDEQVGQGLRYRATPLRECYWSENHQGHVDTLYRRYELTARAAAQKAKAEGWQLPPKIVAAAEKEPLQCFEFLHCVQPNPERIPSRQDYRGMAFSSHTVAVEEGAMVKVSGYRTWPYAIGRFMKAPGETYARSPAMAAFPSIMTANEQKKTVLRAGQKAVDPPILLSEEGVMEAFNMRSGALNYGALNSNGEELVKPFNSQAKVETGVELLMLEQRAINDAFMVSLFQILAEKPDMTATEVMARLQEKASLLSPTTGRLEAEDLGPMIEREVDLLAHDPRHAWILEEMPDSLRETGGGFRPVYTSPLSRARRAGDALAITRTMEVQSVAIQIDSRAKFALDVPGAMREVADINGVPARFVRTVEQIEQMAASEEQRAMLASAAELAPGVAQAAKSVAEAEQIRGAA